MSDDLHQAAKASNGKEKGAQKAEKSKPFASFAVHVTIAFILTAIMSSALVVGVSFIVWNAGRGGLFDENNMMMALLIAVVVAILLAVVVGGYFASDITAPINRISTAAKAIRDGDFSARTNLTGEDELGQLGEAFDAMAESIERDRELERQLIGDVAHELRTPLMAIQATVEAIQDGVLPADETRLATITGETRRLGRLVEALLHLNRLENGTIVAKRDPVDLSGTIADLALNHQMLIEVSGLEFEVSIEPGVRIVGDKDLIDQATANLISNAVRYTAEGGKITLTLERLHNMACISVADTGIGISEEDKKKVFSRFWRADSARERASGGLGIGLSLVREVVDQHHGRVAVSSELGKGSTFQILVPLAPDDPAILASMDKSELRRVARAAKKEQDRLRREAEKQRKEKERQERQATKGSSGLTNSLPRVQLPSFKREPQQKQDEEK